MKRNNRTNSLLIGLALMAGILFSGCGGGGGGGGGNADTKKTWYQDSDGDGFGNNSKTQIVASQPEGYVDNGMDCNDSNASVNPGAVEINDTIDNNCDGVIDEAPKAGVVPDTSQAASYTSTFGEDSDYLIDPPSFTKLDENGQALPDDAASWKMVKDNVTGLVWILKTSYDGVVNYKNIHDADNTYTWAEATSVFIAKLNEDNYGNFDDENTWRLPNVREMAYLTDCSQSLVRISTKYFGAVSQGKVWTSTPNLDPDTQAWYAWPYYGLSDLGEKTEKYGVWAVRGTERKSELETFGAGIVRDKTTGLVWQKVTGKTGQGKAMTYEQAIEYCENLELSGFKDWRLPSRNELISLLRHDLASPAIEKGFFTDIQAGGYWTSTTFVAPASLDKAWKIDFNTASLAYDDKTKIFWVLAVRGGNNATLRKWYLDKDTDGYGDPAVYKLINSSVSGPDGYVLNSNDCNDENDAISPAASEIADDGIDQNCSGKDLLTWYQDSDGDGYGNKTKTVFAETKPASYVRNTAHIEADIFDCNDTNTSVNPGMIEIADDGIDNDCNGLQSKSWYVDADNDGYGEGLSVVASEEPPAGATYAPNDLDCNDDNPGIRPGLVEVFGNLSDTNCNGELDDESLHVIPDTGQVASYTGTPGEDGDYLINSPSLTKIAANGDFLPVGAAEWVAVRDNITGLYWEVKTVDNKNAGYTFAAAADYAGTLVLAGLDDWRLPSVTELATVAHLDASNPAINGTYFANMVANKYWTATDLGSQTTALTVSFQRGATYLENKTNYALVLVVRGGRSLASRLLANGDGTVTDTETGLMWNDFLTTNNTWDGSMAAWAADTGAGYNDWRMPSESDIATLLDILEQDDAFDFSQFFQNVTFTGSFWTSTLALTDPDKAIVYSFITGEADEADLVEVLRGLGVRGVKQGRFIANADGTVFDSRTGLMWMRENTNNNLGMTMESALEVCNALTYAGYSDWRMPSRNEMISLLEAFIDDQENYLGVFEDSEARYWTSSSCTDLAGFAWQITFETGAVDISIGPYVNENVFRAVRGGSLD